MTRALQNHLPDLTHLTTLAGLWMPQYLPAPPLAQRQILLPRQIAAEAKPLTQENELAGLSTGQACGSTFRGARAGPLRRFSARCALLVVKVELHSHTATQFRVVSCTAEPSASHKGDGFLLLPHQAPAWKLPLQ